MEKRNLWTLYTSLQGRISKRTFLLWFFLPIAVTQILAALVDTALYPPNNLSEFGGPWEATQRLLAFWPGVAGTVKRLHDLEINAKHVGGMYGAWALAIVLFLFSMSSSSTESDLFTPGLAAAAVTGILALIYTLYLLIPCCFRPGIGGPNEYGEDPLVN